mmetsp:Transcript_1210/g.1698  ORF Transcript_1210/g.1698 Transcript_1210/m.1698 type:complete len:106 (-) Transcript_1210:138-455(-)
MSRLQRLRQRLFDKKKKYQTWKVILMATAGAATAMCVISAFASYATSSSSSRRERTSTPAQIVISDTGGMSVHCNDVATAERLMSTVSNPSLTSIGVAASLFFRN